MAKISIRFLAQVKEAINKDFTDLNIKDGETLNEVLHSLIEEFGEPLKNVFFRKDGSVSEELIVFVNGKNIMMTGKGLKITVKDGDQLMVFTPIAGG